MQEARKTKYDRISNQYLKISYSNYLKKKNPQRQNEESSKREVTCVGMNNKLTVDLSPDTREARRET